MRSPDSSPRAGEARRYDLDWLRALAMLLIFVFHTTRPFDTFENWHVKNNQLSAAFDVLMFGALWVMPLFFVLSGASSFYSLRSRTAWSFLRARFLRLAVPLITLGWFVFGPIQVYIERVTQTGYNTPPFSGSFVGFLPHYFEGLYGGGGSFALGGIHLWYLYWLFIFSIVALPLFLYLMGARGRRWVGALAQLVERPGAILLLALPLCLVEALIKLGIGPDTEEAGWYLAAYALLLIYGFVLAADARFDQAIQRSARAALGLAAALLAGLLVTGIPSAAAWAGAAGPVLDGIAMGLIGWAGLVAILGFARRYLNFAHPILRYAGEAVLPIYILHQPIIVVIAYIMRGWAMSVGLKYLILSTTALAITLLAYELLVRRFNLLRFLFGLKRLPGQRAAGRRWSQEAPQAAP